MKTKILMVLALVAGIALQSCKDDSDDLRGSDVPTAVLEAFQQTYPAVQAKWELDRGLYNAEFWQQGVETDVWYQADGTWVRTEVDFVGTLPTAIQQYLATHYSSYRIDDVDIVSLPSTSYYELELEREGTRDITLRITAEGVVVA